MQRLKFKEVKKQIAEILQKDGDTDKVNKLLKEYQEEYRKAESQFLGEQIKIINEDEEAPKALFLNDEDLKFFEKYYNNVYLKRPVMTKEDSEVEKEFNFSIDLENYNPWDEYKNIYSGIYKKGKIHWLLKRMPEWKFLQIGEVNSQEDQATNPRNRLKSNMDDSIFNVLTLDRYFEERQKKNGTYKGKSQSIRI